MKPTALPLALLFATCTSRRAPREAPVQLSPWRELPDSGGGTLTTQGEHTIAAGGGGVTVWQGWRKVRTLYPTEVFQVGLPRLASNRVVFGTGVERTPGHLQPLPLDHLPAPMNAVLRYAAWRADGERVALLWHVGPTARVAEYRADGTFVREVWSGSPLPNALWYGAGGVVVIGREVHAWSPDGAPHRAEGHQGGVSAVSTSRDEALLLTVGGDGIAKLWQTRTWALLAELQGDWVGGSIAPDGRYVALATRRTLRITCVQGRQPNFVGEVTLPGPPTAVALGDDRIVRAFLDGALVQMAHLQVRCP